MCECNVYIYIYIYILMRHNSRTYKMEWGERHAEMYWTRKYITVTVYNVTSLCLGMEELRLNKQRGHFLRPSREGENNVSHKLPSLSIPRRLFYKPFTQPQKKWWVKHLRVTLIHSRSHSWSDNFAA